MERFVKLVAPTGLLDFVWKLIFFLLMCGILNHVRDILINGVATKSFVRNLGDASFTALPMCAGGLALIGHLRNLQNTLHAQALRDALTGLRNRRWFMERWCETPPPKSFLLLIDIDHFKSVNDIYGHPFGDLALETFARHLEQILPDGVHAARLGGEEFAVVMPSFSIAQATDIAIRIAQGCQVADANGPEHWITSSVGGTMFQTATTLTTALARADEALYVAKAAGRAQFKFVAPVCIGPDVKIVASSVPARRAMSH